MKNKAYMCIFPSILIGIFIGFLIPSPNIKNTFKETRDKQHYKFINPLLECDFESISTDKNLNELKENINFIINQQKSINNVSFVSVYYRDLNNGPWFGINEKEYFSPASLIKVPLMIAYLKEAEQNPSLLEKEIINTKDYDPTEQNFTPSIFLQKDQKYTIHQLIEQMIIQSDNIPYELLLNNIDNNLVFKVYSDLGVDISKAQNNPNGNIITVKDYASFYRILYNSSYLNRQMSEKALSVLSQTIFDKGLVAKIPKDVPVAHKFGERKYIGSNEHQLHDCGIIYHPKKPYLLCVMTRGTNFEKLENAINQISKTIYEEINK
jgi:beta-lactamase class A